MEQKVEMAPVQLLVLFRAVTTLLWSDFGTFFILEPTVLRIFARYLAYNITILQTIDITDSSNVW